MRGQARGVRATFIAENSNFDEAEWLSLYHMECEI